MDGAADQTNATGTIAVKGTAASGATVDVADVASDHGSTATHTHETAAADGSFSIPVTLATGTNVIVVTATTAHGATAQITRAVVHDIVEGTPILNVGDPANDDHGPGNYAYPTDPIFHPGAYDITNFQVYDTGSTVTFRVPTRDLSETFGSPRGAQLVDVYVHQPGATPTSTAASFPQRNYVIDPADAWSRLIEVQGLGQRFIDAATRPDTVGTVNISANAISRYITFSVATTALGGTPTHGWAFIAALAGQDGFSSDNARAFTTTPGPNSFGVCANANSTPLCTANPNTVPTVMDSITPSGVAQSNELDYTIHHPVVLSGVTVP